MAANVKKTQFFRETHSHNFDRDNPQRGGLTQFKPNKTRQYQMEAMVELRLMNGSVVEQEGYSFIRAQGDSITTAADYNAMENECKRSARINYGRSEEEKRTESSGMFRGSLLPLHSPARIIWSRVIIHREVKTRFVKDKTGKILTDDKGNQIRDTEWSPAPIRFKQPVTAMQRYNGKHYVQIDSPKGKLWREMETGVVYSNGSYNRKIKKGLPAKPYYAKS